MREGRSRVGVSLRLTGKGKGLGGERCGPGRASEFGRPRERYGEVRVRVIGELMSAFGSNDVDVVILNEAPPLLTYEGVIQGGRLLFE